MNDKLPNGRRHVCKKHISALISCIQLQRTKLMFFLLLPLFYAKYFMLNRKIHADVGCVNMCLSMRKSICWRRLWLLVFQKVANEGMKGCFLHAKKLLLRRQKATSWKAFSNSLKINNMKLTVLHTVTEKAAHLFGGRLSCCIWRHNAGGVSVCFCGFRYRDRRTASAYDAGRLLLCLKIDYAA